MLVLYISRIQYTVGTSTLVVSKGSVRQGLARTEDVRLPQYPPNLSPQDLHSLINFFRSLISIIPLIMGPYSENKSFSRSYTSKKVIVSR
jgi:hypothetical protein